MYWYREKSEMIRKMKVSVCALVVMLGIRGVAAAQSSPEQAPQGQSQSQSQQPPASPPATNEQVPAPNQDQNANPNPAAPAPAANPAPTVTRDPDAPVLKRKTSKKKRTPASNSGKVVVRNGGAKERAAQLAPAMTKEQEQHNRENTSQLLATTDANLKTVSGRQLTPSQQSMLDEVHTYIAQSKAATNAGDVARAHTLAYKAHLLSDELAKK